MSYPYTQAGVNPLAVPLDETLYNGAVNFNPWRQMNPDNKIIEVILSSGAEPEVDKLLPNRKLKFLMQRPLENLSETKDGFSLLLFWYWEECLKERYSRFVVALEEATKDMLPILKDKAVKE
ncbi:hypothetical protein QJS10_CPB12g00751 [Acorus calamus]|uniref:Uncharacterized protein n=1 Tax=Acorus calamus TaxID=4465 RepID=A0AAV9DM69_ACOCL|nr:hypothetical protein QJS10_CPB12g00751 [Acorus calamus]